MEKFTELYNKSKENRDTIERFIVEYWLAGKLIREKFGQSRAEFIEEYERAWNLPLKEYLESIEKVFRKVDELGKEMVRITLPYYEKNSDSSVIAKYENGTVRERLIRHFEA